MTTVWHTTSGSKLPTRHDMGVSINLLSKTIFDLEDKIEQLEQDLSECVCARSKNRESE